MSTIDQDWERYWRAPDGEEPAALRAQIAKLEAENARLRAALVSLTEYAGRMERHLKTHINSLIVQREAVRR